MGTKVESKTYFPGSVMDLNNGLCNGTWDLYHDDRTSGSEKSLCYDSFLMRQATDGYPGYAKEQMRQTILKQESIFRHQLQELHRLYKRQRDLMNELAVKEHYNFPILAEASKSSRFLSQVPSRVSKEMHPVVSNYPHVDLTFGRETRDSSLFSHPDHLKGKNALNEFRPLNSNCSITERRVIDLELPAVDEDNEGKRKVENGHYLGTERAYNLADLNEPIHMEETSFSASRKIDLSSNSGFWCSSKITQQNLKEKEQLSYGFANGKTNAYYDQNKVETLRKRTIFGIEICERDHTPSFDSSKSSNPQTGAINSESSFTFPWRKTASSHNGSTHHWLGSSDAPRQIQELFAGNKHFNDSNSRAGVPYQNGVSFRSGINFKNPVSDSLQEARPTKKQNVMDVAVQNRHDERRLPPWLTAESSLGSEQTKGKETTLYQMNLDSLQNHSQQFFKKPEPNKDQADGATKILGVPIINVPDSKGPEIESNGKDNFILDLKHHIDLNLAFDEEEAPPLAPNIPESVVKIAATEIDLEAPAVLESETDPPEISLDTDDFKDSNEELVKVAAEAIVSISSSNLVTNQPSDEPPPPPPADSLLRWFAGVITLRETVNKDSENVNNDEDSIPEGMDYFEYMTLNLQEKKVEYDIYKPMISEEKEEDGLLRKRAARKGQGKRGRQRKDFQRDVLPGIVSLSRREVTEDLQIFEEAFSGIGVSWQSSLSKRKAAAKNGRGRRRLAVAAPTLPPLSPPPAAVIEQAVCREVALDEKGLSGWGKRTRRLPRQRCQNGGGNHHSLALKC